MTNSINLKQAVSQHKYNSWVLNFIILGGITSILTAIFIPWGYGKFSGISLLIGTQITAIVASLATQKNEGEGLHWMNYFIPFCFLSLISIAVTSSLFVEFLNMGHSYADIRKTLPGSDTKIAGMMLGIVVTTLFGLLGVMLTKGVRRKNTYVDYFLLNSAVAYFFWKRSSNVKVNVLKDFIVYSTVVIVISILLYSLLPNLQENHFQQYSPQWHRIENGNFNISWFRGAIFGTMSVLIFTLWLLKNNILKYKDGPEATTYTKKKFFPFLYAYATWLKSGINR